MFVLMVSCNNETINNNEELVARVGNTVLLKSDLESAGFNLNDSSASCNLFVNNWIENQLVVNKAKSKLEIDKSKINKLVEDYENTLYANKYIEKYILKNLDTIIRNEDFEKFYELNKSSFLLDRNIVKTTFIKLPIKTPNRYKIKRWFKSGTEEDLDELNAFCMQNAEKFDDFKAEWIDFDDVLQFVPIRIVDKQKTLKKKKYIETRDSSFYYFVNIDEYKLKNDTTPIDLIKQEISNLIIIERKKELLLTLKTNLKEDAKNKNLIERF